MYVAHMSITVETMVANTLKYMTPCRGGCKGGIVAPKRVIHNKPRDRYDEGKGLLREWVGVETG